MLLAKVQKNICLANSFNLLDGLLTESEQAHYLNLVNESSHE